MSEQTPKPEMSGRAMVVYRCGRILKHINPPKVDYIYLETRMPEVDTMELPFLPGQSIIVMTEEELAARDREMRREGFLMRTENELTSNGEGYGLTFEEAEARKK